MPTSVSRAPFIRYINSKFSLLEKQLLATFHSMKEKFSGNVCSSLPWYVCPKRAGVTMKGSPCQVLKGRLSRWIIWAVGREPGAGGSAGGAQGDEGRAAPTQEEKQPLMDLPCLPGPAHRSSPWRQPTLLSQGGCHSRPHFPRALCERAHDRIHYNVV